MHDVFIGIGSNLGDRYGAIQSAVNLMSPEIFPVSFSKVYETPPWGYEDQPSFLNQVVKAQTELQPLELLIKLITVEKQIGRQPNIRYGPRLIDLDILFYDDLIFDSTELVIPHPEIIHRAFVLIPMLDIVISAIYDGW